MVPYLTVPFARHGRSATRTPPDLGRTLIVEFVGLPGCGKTTVAEQVLPLLSARGVRCRGRRSPLRPWRTRLRGYLSTAVFHLRHPGPVTAGIASALTLTPRRLRRIPHALRMAGWARRLKQRRIGHHDLIVLDQGVVQDAWSLLLGASGEDNRYLTQSIRASVGDAAVGLAYVYFDTDIGLAASRIRSRPSESSRLDVMRDTEAREVMAAHHADLERYFTLAVQVSGAPSCRVDASAPLEETRQRVLEFIVDTLASERGRTTATARQLQAAQHEHTGGPEQE